MTSDQKADADGPPGSRPTPPTDPGPGPHRTVGLSRTPEATFDPPPPGAAVPAPPGYEVLGEIGRGGMGVVCRVLDRTLNRPLALKALHEQYGGHAEMAQRFVSEARVCGQLQHPGVAPVHHIGTLSDGRPFFTMKLVEGHTLAELLRRRGAPEEGRERFLGVFEAVCQTVAYAHSKGILHRDLKPSNIMVGEFGEVQVMDWGLAKRLSEPRPSGSEGAAPLPDGRGSDVGQTHAGTVLGTPAYMPPEQARGELERVGPASDVFALGAILCEVLTGRPPYTGSNAEVATQSRAGHLDPALARLQSSVAGPELIALAGACLAARPEDRPADADAVAEAVRVYRQGVEERLRRAEADRAAAAARAEEQRKRHRVQLALAAALAGLLLVAGGSFIYWQRETARRAEERERAGVELYGATLAALERANERKKQERWGEAKALLTQARERLGDDGPEDLTAELDQALADLELVRRLDEIRQQKATTLVGATIDHAGVDRAYEALFREQKLGAPGDDPAAVGDRVAKSGVREQLVTALDTWAFTTVDPRRREWVFAVARRADPHPWRDRFRTLELWHDLKGLPALAKQANLDELPSAIVVVLGEGLPRREEGLHLLREAQRRRPADFWITMTLGTHLPDETHLNEAIAFRRAAVALRPDAGVAHLNLGAALARSKQHDEAIHSLRKAIDTGGGEGGLAQLNLAVIWRSKGDLDQALHWHREAIKRLPRFADAHYEHGRTWRKKGNRDEAAACFRKAVEVAPKCAEAHMALGDLAEEDGKRSEALACFRKAVAANPRNAELFYGLGHRLSGLGRADDGIACYQKAVALNPRHARAHTNLGLLLSHKGEVDQAIACYHKALAANPRLVNAHNNLGLALMNKDKPEQAADCFRRVLDLAPNDVKAHSNFGITLAMRERFEEALVWYGKALALDAKNAPAHHSRALSLMELGRYAEAEAALKQALALYPALAPGRQRASSQLGMCRRLKALEERLPKVLAGEDRPADGRERLTLAGMCAGPKRRYADGARLYAEAFAEDPRASGDALRESALYRAARAAARAGLGQGKGALRLSDAERLRLRGQALDWLTADLKRLAELAGKDDVRPQVRRVLQRWQQDPVLAGLRGDEVAELPEAERAGWRKLWADVRELAGR